MGVDDVLRIVGAAPRGGTPAAATATPQPPAPAAAPAAGAAAEDGAEDRAEDRADDGAPADHPRLRGEGEPGVRELPGPSAGLAPETTDRVVPALDPALDAAAGRGDWRAALQAAGSAPTAPGPATTSTPEDEAMAKPAARKRTPSPERADPGEQPSAGMAPSTAPGAAGVRDPADGRRAAATPASGAPFPGTDVPTGLVVGGAPGELFGGPFAEVDSLDRIAELVRACTRCPLHRTATQGVPGEGKPDAELVVVGEAPGADEDASGRPFVGASGQLLTKILAAINLRREDVFIANVVKHRPPGNRNPAPDEVEACSPYLVRQLEVLRPKVILTVGNFAAQTLLGTKLGISKLRGQVHLYHGVPLVATYHPAALLRNPTWKRPTWEDVQLARRLLDRPAAAG